VIGESARKAAAAAGRGEPGVYTLRVNGREHCLLSGRDIAPWMSLGYVLREVLGLTGLKLACAEGACGACTVILDGKAVLSCLTLAVAAAGHEIVTVEGLGVEDPVVAAFVAQAEPGYGTALQCGYCTPGFVVTARALLDRNPRPSLQEVHEGLGGNICRCGCYAGIARAVTHAACGPAAGEAP